MAQHETTCANFCGRASVWMHGCGSADTAGCVELLDADKPDGVGENGCEGVGVRAEEDSVVGCCKRE